MASKSGVKILNFNEVLYHMKKLDLADKAVAAMTRKVLRVPFNKMRTDARRNLKNQGSMRAHDLYKGMSVSTKLSKRLNYFTIAFGGRAIKEKGADGKKRYKNPVNHFHLVNSGTVKRRHKNGKNVGAVGKGTSNAKNMNKSFQIGFADRAIKPIIPTIKSTYGKGFGQIINSIKTKGV